MTTYFYVRLPRAAHASEPEVAAMAIPVANYAVPVEVAASASTGMEQIPGVRFIWIDGVPSHCWVRFDASMTSTELTEALEEFRACF